MKALTFLETAISRFKEQNGRLPTHAYMPKVHFDSLQEELGGMRVITPAPVCPLLVNNQLVLIKDDEQAESKEGLQVIRYHHADGEITIFSSNLIFLSLK